MFLDTYIPVDVVHVLAPVPPNVDVPAPVRTVVVPVAVNVVAAIIAKDVTKT